MRSGLSAASWFMASEERAVDVRAVQAAEAEEVDEQAGAADAGSSGLEQKLGKNRPTLRTLELLRETRFILQVAQTH